MFRTLLAAGLILASFAASTHAHCGRRCEPVRTALQGTASVVVETAKVAKGAACVVKNRVLEPTLEAGAELVRHTAKTVREYSIRVQKNAAERRCQRCIKREARELERTTACGACDEAKPFSGEVESGSYSTTK